MSALAFCEECGKDISERAQFCSYCGTKVILNDNVKSDASISAAQEIKMEKDAPKQMVAPIINNSESINARSVNEQDKMQRVLRQFANFPQCSKATVFTLISVLVVVIGIVVISNFSGTKETPTQWVSTNKATLFEVKVNDVRVADLSSYVEYYSRIPDNGNRFANIIIGNSRDLQQRLKSFATNNREIEELSAAALKKLEKQEKWAKYLIDNKFSPSGKDAIDVFVDNTMYDLLTKNYGINENQWMEDARLQLKKEGWK